MPNKFLSSILLSALGLTMLPPVAHAAPTTRDVALTNIMEQLVPTRVFKGDREFDGHGPLIKTTVNVRISDDGRKLLAKVYFRAEEDGGDGSLTKGEWERTVYTAPSGSRIKRIQGALLDGQLTDSPACVGLPAGRCISSTTEFKSVKAGFQFIAPTEDWTAFIDAIVDLVEQCMRAEQQMNDRDEPTPEERQATEILRLVREGKQFIPSAQNHVHVELSDNGGPVHVFAIVGDTGGPDISTDSNGRDDTRINSIMFRSVRIELE